MANYHHWSTEDSNLLHAEIKNSPTNLQVAFKKVARKINVTPQAVAKYYYRTVQKEKHNKLFLTISSKKEATNYKVTRKGKYATQYQPEKTKKSKWKRILEILAE